MNIHNLILTSLIALPVIAYAESVQNLPTEWAGTLTVTSIGANTKNNPGHKHHKGENEKIEGWNTYTAPRTLTIVKQEGRHLEILQKGPHKQTLYAGTLSEDGKQLYYVSEHGDGSMVINGNKMSGCGVSRGTDGTFEHWLKSYSSWCQEFTAAK